MRNIPYHEHKEYESWWFSRTFLVTIGTLLILGFLIYTGHSAHLLGALPYLLLLACPLMHHFMHGGHQRHGSGPQVRENDPNDANKHSGGCC